MSDNHQPNAPSLICLPVGYAAPAAHQDSDVPKRAATSLFDVLAALPEDILAEGRQDEPPQVRDGL